MPVSLLRARGGIVEIGVDDLAMSGPEAQSLLVGAGVAFAEDLADELVDRTEGWPAGLYLAALAINAGSRVESSFRFTGDDRFIGDYLRSEFLQRVSRADVSFLTRTSILDRMSGPLCDVTAGRTGSSRVLDRLERRNLLVLPLDRRGEWYRYHHLFRELLHAELTQREPDMVPELHTRAAAWYEANNLPEAAIEHAQHAGDVDRVARLVLKVANPVWASGRLDTVLRWMEWFSANDLIESQPAIAVHGALIYALIGRAGDAERWARAAERTTFRGTLADGNTMESSLAYLRALLCRNGVDEMRRDAHLALEGLSPLSPYRAGHAPRRGSGRSAPRRPRPGRPVLRSRRGRGDQCWCRAVHPCRLGRAGHRRHRARRLVRGRGAVDSGAGDHAGRQLRRLLDERSCLRMGRPRRVPEGRRGSGP